MEYFLRLNQLFRFLTTLYQQDIESGQEQVILLVVAGVVTGMGTGMATDKLSKPKIRLII